jgi:prolyl 4-hydroxylase
VRAASQAAIGAGARSRTGKPGLQSKISLALPVEQFSFAILIAKPAAMLNPGESSANHLMQFKGMQRVPSKKADLFIMRGFLSEAECEPLMRLIDAQRQPSTLVSDDGTPGFRTSETCYLDHAHPAVAALDAKLGEVSGIAPEYGEALQGQRYEIGQEFMAHTDYFEPTAGDYREHTDRAGQRTWTFMIYLNDVAGGGATRFKHLDKIVRPETGKLLAWNNRTPDGGLNAATLHHAMKVRKGLKYVVTRWYRERPWR